MRLATVDSPLPPLGDRRSLLQRLAAARGQAAVRLVVVDVDCFRELNARHGHGVGDSVISELRDIFVTGTRREDAVVRLGRASYAVLVAPSDERRVRGLADRLPRDVAAHPWWRLAPGLAVTINADVISDAGVAPFTTRRG